MSSFTAINVDKWNRARTFEWFKQFSNSTYSMNVSMDVTKLVEHTKDTGESFFIDLMYVLLRGMSSIDEMRMRLVDGVPVIFDDISPAFTVMTESGTFENVRFRNAADFGEFYHIASSHIENAKKQTNISDEDYNPDSLYDEYYLTCVPWVDFAQFTHPIPDDLASQCIPRLCWGKYEEQNDGSYKMMLNITVSHIFVDGYPLARAFNVIQALLDVPASVLV